MRDDYSFLQETIKDEAGSKKNLKKKIFRMIGLGVILGIVACFTFFASKSWMEEAFEKEPEKITIPKDEETDVTKSEQAIAIEENYRQMIQTMHGVTRNVNRSLVTMTVLKQDSNGTEQSVKEMTGVIVADDGKNYLVLAQAVSATGNFSYQSSFADGENCTVHLKKRDMNMGFAIYSIEKKAVPENVKKQMEVATLGNSNLTSSGDVIILLGKSDSGKDMVSYGIVASVEERIEVADGFFNLTRTDAAGAEIADGIFVNRDGEVIGIIREAAVQSEKKMLITAYNISDMKDEIESLSNGISIPYIGINGLDVTKAMSEKEIPDGIYVNDIETDSPAMRAGIQRGDVVTHIAEKEITNLSSYRVALMQQKVGDEIVLKGKRLGANDEYVEIEYRVTVGTKE